MDAEPIKSQWRTFRGRMKEEWGKLNDDELDVLKGQMDQHVGKTSVNYGFAKAEAYRKLKALEAVAHEAERTN